MSKTMSITKYLEEKIDPHCSFVIFGKELMDIAFDDGGFTRRLLADN